MKRESDKTMDDKDIKPLDTFLDEPSYVEMKTEDIKAEVEESDATSDSKFSIGFLILLAGGIWALVELFRAIFYFF